MVFLGRLSSHQFSIQAERLRRAQAVLAQVEARQDMHTATHVAGFRNVEERGAYHLDGRIETLLTVLSSQEDPDAFTALVGVNDVGWDRAAASGINVEHVVVIGSCNGQVEKVVGTLLEGFQTVVVGSFKIAPRHQRALAARARKLRTLLLTMNPWEGVSVPYAVNGSDRSYRLGVKSG